MNTIRKFDFYKYDRRDDSFSYDRYAYFNKTMENGDISVTFQQGFLQTYFIPEKFFSTSFSPMWRAHNKFASYIIREVFDIDKRDVDFAIHTIKMNKNISSN